MGKSNRIRSDRATREVKSLNTKKQKKGMPSWLMTVLALVVTLAILLSVVGLLLSANGVFNRWAKALSTEHFKVNANMLSYYYHTQYQTFLSQQSNSLTYFSLDTAKSLKDQQFGGPENLEEGEMYYDAIFLGEYEGTWFDYFMDQTVESVSSLLIYCEAAYARNIELEDADQKEIDANLTSLGSTATSYGYPSVDAYISAMYGEGVKEKDVRKAMEYSMLATKGMSALSDEIATAITDTQISDTYNASPNKFNLIDFSYYTFRVNYTDIQKEIAGADATESEINAKKNDILLEYKNQIAKAKENAAKLAAMTTLDEVNNFVMSQIAADEVDTAWEQLSVELGEGKENLRAAIQEALVAMIVTDILAGELDSTTDAKDNVAIKDLGLAENVLGNINTVQTTAFTATLSAKETYLREKVAFSENDEFLVWAFDGKKPADTKVIMKGDGSGEGEIVNTDNYFSASAYFLAKAPYKDVEATKNIAYMLFTSEDAAKATIQAMMDRGNIDLTTFETLATEFGASTYNHREDYVKGDLQSTVFDTWLYDAATDVGTYTLAPLTLELDGSTFFCVALYHSKGHESWYVSVKQHLLTNRFDAAVADLTAANPVTIKEKALDRVDA